MFIQKETGADSSEAALASVEGWRLPFLTNPQTLAVWAPASWRGPLAESLFLRVTENDNTHLNGVSQRTEQ